MTAEHQKQHKVTVIIPVYNAARFITDTVLSAFNQTYSNINYIFVDDCSTDNSLRLLENLVSKSNRDAKIIKNDVNLGSALSRNKAIEIADGDYLCFCDSDDLMQPHMVESLLNAAIDNDADIVTAPYLEFKGTDPNDTKLIPISDYNSFYDLNAAPIDTPHFSLCNKILRRELIVSLINETPHVNCWDDLAITARAFAVAKRKCTINSPIYLYRKGHSRKSLTSQSHDKRLPDQITCARFINQWFIEHQLNEKYAPFIKFLKFTAKIKYLRGKNRNFEKWATTFPESNSGIMRYRNVPIYYRLMFFTVAKMPAFIRQKLTKLCQSASDSKIEQR